jgi:protein SCO1/2
MTTLSRRSLLLGAGASILAASTLAVGEERAPAPKVAAPQAGPLPAKSIYQLTVPLTDQSGKTFQLAERRGGPMIISMFYTSCQYVCPMLMESIQATEQKLSAAERARLKVTLVSFDPEHDTVEVLRKTADSRTFDSSRWALARTDASSVRKLAAMLGIQYRAIGNGDFNHSTALILLDAEGQIVGKTSELGSADAVFVKALKRTLSSS